MKSTILQAEREKRVVVFDPRTKLLLLIVMSTIVLGGMAGAKLWFLLPCFCVMPFLLLVTEKRIKSALLYLFLYVGIYLINMYAAPHLSGFFGFLLQGCAGMITRFMPTVTLAMYVMSSTTVSEFTASMQKLHISEKIIIPLSVMFRLFPTIANEFSAINSAMKMRGISFGGNNVGKIVEYRLVPLMSCSVKIGDELSAAALTRGLGGTVKRTNVCKIGFHFQDYVILLLCIGSALAVILEHLGLF